MAEKDDKKEQEPELEVVEVDDDGKPLPQGGQAEGIAQTSGAAEPADEDEDHDEERLRLGQDDPEQRKKDRALKAEKRRQARLRDQQQLQLLQRQNAELAQRLQQLEARSGGQDLTLITDRITNANRLVQQADQVIADAIAKQDGKRAAEALKVRDDARDQVTQLSQLKVQVEHRAREAPRQEQQAAGLPPAIAERVRAFQGKHPWYDAAGRDVDSGVIQRLDQAVADEGYDPAGQDYWDELERRAAKYLPHRFGDGQQRAAGNGQQQRRSGPPMHGGGDAPASINGKKMVYINPARRKAMEEAGAWDDPIKRQKMLKAYERYDREHAGQRN